MYILYIHTYTYYIQPYYTYTHTKIYTCMCAYIRSAYSYYLIDFASVIAHPIKLSTFT